MMDSGRLFTPVGATLNTKPTNLGGVMAQNRERPWVTNGYGIS